MSEVSLLEAAAVNNLPALAHILYDGWLLRITPGYATHNNSVWPLYPGQLPLEAKIAFCQDQYTARGLTCEFRLSALPEHAAIEALLIARGYEVSNPNWVMVRGSTVAPAADITVLPLDEWLDTIYPMNPGTDLALLDWERRVLAQIALPTRYAIVKRNGVACAYGRSVQQGHLLNLEDLWTLPAWRRQGLGTQLICGLLQLGRASGAAVSYLAVNEANLAARRLYERLGYTNGYLYRYLGPTSEKVPLA